MFYDGIINIILAIIKIVRNTTIVDRRNCNRFAYKNIYVNRLERRKEDSKQLLL